MQAPRLILSGTSLKKLAFLTLLEFDFTSKNAETSSQIESRKVVSLGDTVCTIIFAQLPCLVMITPEV